MRRKAWLLLAVAPAALALVTYLLTRSSVPAPVSGGEPAKPALAAPTVNQVAEARALMARVKAQSELAASAKPIVPRVPPVPMTGPMPGAVGPGGPGQVNEKKAEAALHKLRDRMDLERNDAGLRLPKVGAIMEDGGRPLALIGDGLVSEGDTVDGYRVKKIQSDSVEFEKDGRTWVRKVN